MENNEKAKEDKSLTCIKCNCILENTNTQVVDNAFYCINCFNEYFFYCDNCNEITIISDIYQFRDKDYCEDCYNELTGVCDNCDDIFYNHELSYSEDAGAYYCVECYQDEQPEQVENIKPHLFEYTKPITFNTSKSFKQNHYKEFLGIEIECNYDKKTKTILNKNELHKSFSCINDGSIGIGKEFINNEVTNGDLFFNNLKEFLKDLNKRHYFVTDKTGLHIHIDLRNYKNDLEFIKKLYYIYYHNEKFLYYMLPESRSNNVYCRKLNKKELNALIGTKDINEFLTIFYNNRSLNDIIRYYIKSKSNDKRYRGFNLHSFFYRGTLELRYHSGTLDFKKIKNWILLNLRLIELAKIKSYDELKKMFNRMTVNKFLKSFDKKIQKYIIERINKFNFEVLLKKNIRNIYFYFNNDNYIKIATSLSNDIEDEKKNKAFLEYVKNIEKRDFKNTDDIINYLCNLEYQNKISNSDDVYHQLYSTFLEQYNKQNKSIKIKTTIEDN